MACTRSNSARLATWVKGSRLALSARLWQRCSNEISEEASCRSRIVPRVLPLPPMTAVIGCRHGHATAVAAPDREPPQGLHPGGNRRQHGAIGLADGLVLLVAELENLRVPALLVEARAGDARQPFGPVVPLHNAALRVDEDHGVVHIVQELALEDRRFAQRAGGGERGCGRIPVGVGRPRIERKQPRQPRGTGAKRKR